MTSTAEINRYMMRNVKDIKDGLEWAGVFASNNLPAVQGPNFYKGACYIFNYSPDYQAGSHWVACRVGPKASYIHWFDSYGERAGKDNSVLKEHARFQKWIQNVSMLNNGRVSYNPYDFQSLYSDVCGLYSIYFCLNDLPQSNQTAWNRFFLLPSQQLPNAFGSQLVETYTTAKADNDALIKKLVRIPLSL